jgi:pimeloyl-ACP methyl ester carboxylesterase
VYAVDTPGFGNSDPLPGDALSVSELAEAYARLLDTLELTEVIVYGTHSGAAIGLELGYRHPAKVAAFVLEGVPVFTPEEQRPLLSPQYMEQFEPDILGGHFARTWTRFHDQFVWFPWYQRTPSQLNEDNAGSAEDIHLWVEMYFQAMRHEYRPAYRAVIRYGAAALEAIRGLRQPGVFLAARSDMLYPHLDRFPALASDQHIERVDDASQMASRIERALLTLPARSSKPPPASPPRSAELVYHDLPCGQLLLRQAGLHHDGPALLVLHDAPGAGRALLPLHEQLGTLTRVLLPDLPGCGESDPLAKEPPTLADYADALADLLAAHVTGAVNVYGVGFGAALALELNTRHPARVRAMLLTGLLQAPVAERQALHGRLAPPIQLQSDGSHWYRTWLMLRDSLVRWPWYSRSVSSLRRQATRFDAGELHAWTCELMRQWRSYDHLVNATLSWNPQPGIEAAGGKLTVGVDSGHALHGSDEVWAARAGTKAVFLPGNEADRAQAIAEVLSARTQL